MIPQTVQILEEKTGVEMTWLVTEAEVAGIYYGTRYNFCPLLIFLLVLCLLARSLYLGHRGTLFYLIALYYT